MDVRVLTLSVVCLFVCASGSSFDNFNLALNKVANDLESINKDSADRFRNSAGLGQSAAAPSTTAAPPATKSCGGWLQKACPPTTTPPPTPPPTTAAPEPCGGWFQKTCPPTTPPPPPTTLAPVPEPKKASCGGWLQKACPPTTTAPPTTTTTTTAAPEPCGGWFQKSCPSTTAAPPPPTPVALAKSCGGWFSSSCAIDITTTPPPKSSGWGLFGPYSVTTDTPTPAPTSGGWISSIFTGFKTTADKAVGTALDLTSKIATVSLNNGVDFFLGQIKLVVKTTNMDVVPLPDLDIPLYPGASLKATGGYFKSVLSISRGGDIVVSRDGLAFVLDIPVELKDMEIGFKDYTITVLMGMGTSGNIKVGVQTNRINIRIRLALSTKCTINLEKVDFAVLDGLDIQMTYGCSACGFITDKASTYLANFLKNTIRLQIQGQIDSILQKTLGDSSLICSKFMGG